MKICKHCGARADQKRFYVKEDGRPYPYCTECHGAKVKARYLRVRDPARVKKPAHDPSSPKNCPSCKQVKDPVEFYRKPDKALTSYCRTCVLWKQKVYSAKRTTA